MVDHHSVRSLLLAITNFGAGVTKISSGIFDGAFCYSCCENLGYFATSIERDSLITTTLI